MPIISIPIPIWWMPRYKIVTDDSGGIPLVEIEVEGTATAAADAQEHRQSRGFVNIPALGKYKVNNHRYVFDHEAPLMTVTVVHFTGGGSALGVAINHGLIDGCGFAKVLKAWSFAHVHGWNHPDTPTLVTKRPECLLPSTASTPLRLAANASSMWSPIAWLTQMAFHVTKDYICDVRSWWGLWSYMYNLEPFMWSSAGKPRARVFFSWKELKALKTTTPCNTDSTNPTASVTPSSSAALGARIWIAFSEVLLPMPQPANRQVQPYVVAEMRSPRISKIYPDFVGNCMEQLRSNVVSDPHNLGSLCGAFHNASLILNNPEAMKGVVDTLLNETVVDVGRGLWGKTSKYAASLDPGTTVHACGINALQSFRLMRLTFGAGSCIGYIPYNIGSRLQMDEAHNGVHVYLQTPPWAAASAPADWIARVESEAFRSRVLHLGANFMNSHEKQQMQNQESEHAEPMGRESISRRESYLTFPMQKPQVSHEPQKEQRESSLTFSPQMLQMQAEWRVRRNSISKSRQKSRSFSGGDDDSVIEEEVSG